MYQAKGNSVGDPASVFLNQCVRFTRLYSGKIICSSFSQKKACLRGYGQKNPLTEYQREGFEMFQELIQRIKEETISRLFRVRLATEPEVAPTPRSPQLVLSRGEEDAKTKPVKRDAQKVGRNDPCPCGSGKKYKKCCGR
jgi:preprotein translocase subunit SecA